MVTGKRKDKLGAEVIAGPNRLTSNVSIEQGGNGSGMDPHRLLEASLTSCTIITLQMYANLKKLDLVDTEVMVRIDSEGPETHMTREIKLIGNLTPEQRKRLIEIADKCPIHRLLSSHMTIETSSIESAG